MNRCLQEAHVPEWMTKGKTTLIQKDPLKKPPPNNYRPIICLPMMWKILTAQIREEIYYSLTSRRLFPKEQKGCYKWSRDTGELLYTDQHNLNESKSYGLGWLQKGIWYGPAKLHNKLPQKVQNIRWTNKLYRENHENLESGIDCRREKLSWNEGPKRYISKQCIITVTIHNCNDAT